MSSNALAVALVLAVAGGQMAAAQRGGAMRFQGMDRNNDGRITRTEWNGSDQSFKVHDWNGDGVLSGDEVHPGARRGKQQNRERDFDTPDRESQFDDWTVRGFNGTDPHRYHRTNAADPDGTDRSDDRIGTDTDGADRPEDGVDIRGGINGETLIHVVVPIHPGGITELDLLARRVAEGGVVGDVPGPPAVEEGRAVGAERSQVRGARPPTAAHISRIASARNSPKTGCT